ncbi:MAG: tetratricopeptide repeat protein [Deltaproteobacteria bacterium]|nr:tetratricopeptide repeat protein [Deltaproteobacteria bacterium]
MGRTLPYVPAIVLAAVLIGATERPASAEPRGQAQGRALDLFEQGAKAYREGRFQDAVDLLLEARKLKSEPVLLYDLGRAYEALGKPVEAADAYEQYLREDPRAADRRAIEGRIATLRGQAAELERARAAPAPPRASQSDGARAAAPVGPEKEPESPSVVPWVLLGTGLAVLGGGLVVGAAASSKHDAAVAEAKQAAAADLQSSAETLATASTITIIAGGVIAAAGLAWLGVRAFSATPAPASARGLRIVPGLGELVVGGRF